jgi:hypothetical protein
MSFVDDDLPVFFSDFGVDILVGSVVYEKAGLLDEIDELVNTGRFESADVGEYISVVTRTDYPVLFVGDSFVLDSRTLTVRQRLKEGDGKLTRLLCSE